jgi:hypothetical protein
MRAKTHRDEELPTIRVAKPLRRGLEDLAARSGHTLSSYSRSVLVNHVVEHLSVLPASEEDQKK